MSQNRFAWPLINDNITQEDKDTLIDFIKQPNVRFTNGQKVRDFEVEWIEALQNSKYGGIVLDDDYEEGAASSIAHRMMMHSDNRVRTMCLEHRTAGFHPSVDNLPPSASKIISKIKQEIIC